MEGEPSAQGSKYIYLTRLILALTKTRHSVDHREDGNKNKNNKEDLLAISQILPTK
jgi:hypothetical protein